jgi:hypothetical protein
MRHPDDAGRVPYTIPRRRPSVTMTLAPRPAAGPIPLVSIGGLRTAATGDGGPPWAPLAPLAPLVRVDRVDRVDRVGGGW